MKTTNRYLLFLMASFCLLFGACSDNDEPLKPGTDPNPGQETSDEIYYANRFAYDVLSDVYLWKNEIAEGLKRLVPETNQDPIKTVSEITYREGDKLVDKWTALTNNLKEMQGSVDGVATTFGYGLQFGKFSNSDSYFAVLTYVVKNSPAEAAGLKRGDIILQINDADITDANYTDLYYASHLSLTVGKVNEENTVIPSGQVSMTAAEMYEDPVLLHKVFDLGAKKVGYIVYNGFDLPSAKTWLEACKEFKQQGISELIVDLRYNGGGYVFTENVIASMLAPAAEVQAKSIYSKEIWNDDYMAYYKQQNQDLNTYFSTTHAIDYDGVKMELDTKDANVGITKIYALVGSGTASASESLLVCLMPLMDVEVIGEHTHGKYCTGMMLGPDDIYKNPAEAIKNWGIYVMINKYTDRNGNNPCIPDGLTPDVECVDNPMDGYLLGDENETLLKEALKRAGKVYTDEAAPSRSAAALHFEALPVHLNPLFGKRIDTKLLDKSKTSATFVRLKDLN